MPRKKQVVQKQKRRKVYSGGAMSADASAIKPKGAFRFFTNYKLFAIIGAVVLIGGIGFTALFQTRSNGGNTNTSIRGEGVMKSTPEPGSTSTTGSQATIKQYGGPPPLTIDPNKTYTATIKTEKGDVKVELLAKEAPETVNNFVFLAKDGFYNGVTFYRVIADEDGQVHFAQAGDPTGTGSGGPGYTLPVEKSDESFSGSVLAMAKPNEAGAPNNGSQFFITLKDEPTFDGKYTVFGKVLSGADVLGGFTPRDPQLQTDPQPGTPIQSITIEES
jgi:cyclophilin family peptidyl-prolyl cis-trans isomerase